MIDKLRKACLYGIGLSLFFSNTINYFYAYKHLNDRILQWEIAFYDISLSALLFCIYAWLTESKNPANKKTIALTGWMTVFSLVNLIGVIMGYTLHTKAFMMILFLIIFLGIAHIAVKRWEN